MAEGGMESAEATVLTTMESLQLSDADAGSPVKNLDDTIPTATSAFKDPENLETVPRAHGIPDIPERTQVVHPTHSLLDLAFTMDCTGSMGTYIHEAQQVISVAPVLKKVVLRLL